MNRPVNPTIFRVVGIMMILIAIFNVVPSLAYFTPDGPVEDSTAQVGPEAETDRAGVLHSTGGIATPMGTMNLIHAPVMAAVGIALLLLKRWEIFAAVVIGIDVLVKVGTILSQAAVGRDLTESIIPIIIIVVDAVLIVLIVQQWSARRNQVESSTRQTREVERAL